ncbi:hypothetical protein [Sanguibacter sp. HDW7]|uniref:hypothetical protein n=1 Tax=Sanguibacter sp. HDW7 TaxID=2714931 RepID=UPI00140C0A33|nr:hypothetical protein [Sanguibacter sp. HDW7]QIK83975.1 hypothetical protein G7063_10355 [Sanguibacter sp. HDW7]
MSAEGGWAEQRREAALVHEQRLREKQAGETARARVLVEDFLVRARAQGVEPEPLLARDYSGGGPYRTGLRGWYVRANRSAAIGEDGEFYVLTVAGGLVARLRGSRPEPSDPPITLGKGGRDGESIDLRDALARVVPES